ncbi:MAG: hypothetical protein MJ252_10345 [archaeon]|nr:hypothetical protein [archaeon]
MSFGYKEIRDSFATNFPLQHMVQNNESDIEETIKKMTLNCQDKTVLHISYEKSNLWLHFGIKCSKLEEILRKGQMDNFVFDPFCFNKVTSIPTKKVCLYNLKGKGMLNKRIFYHNYVEYTANKNVYKDNYFIKYLNDRYDHSQRGVLSAINIPNKNLWFSFFFLNSVEYISNSLDDVISDRLSVLLNYLSDSEEILYEIAMTFPYLNNIHLLDTIGYFINFLYNKRPIKDTLYFDFTDEDVFLNIFLRLKAKKDYFKSIKQKKEILSNDTPKTINTYIQLKRELYEKDRMINNTYSKGQEAVFYLKANIPDHKIKIAIKFLIKMKTTNNYLIFIWKYNLEETQKYFKNYVKPISQLCDKNTKIFFYSYILEHIPEPDSEELLKALDN